MTFPNKRLAAIVGAVFVLLTIPFIAMQLTSEVNWSPADFLVMGVLLLGTGVTCELVMRKVKTARSRIVLCAVVLLALVLVWMELAVGIFGSPFAGS